MAFPMAGSMNYRKPLPTPTIPAGLEQVYKDLIAYSGDFGLLLNLRQTITKYGKLSDKQWAAAKKCLAPKQDAAVILVEKCDIPITVTPSMARKIAKQHNWPVNPCTLIVSQIKSLHRSKYTLKVRMDWSSNVNECRCCGKTLSDWRSQATGVGPVCVKRTKIKYVQDQSDVARFQKEIQDMCAKIGEAEVEVSKWYITVGKDKLDNAISWSTPTKLVVNVPDSFVIPLQYCDWDERSRILTLREHLAPQINSTTDAIAIYNFKTKNTVKFIRRGAIKFGVDNVQFISTELDNPITLNVIK